MKSMMLIAVIIGLGSIIPAPALAQTEAEASADETVKAVVTQVEQTTVDGQSQVTYRLRLTSGPNRGEEVVSGGEGGAIIVNGKIFKTGDRVFVATIHKFDGSIRYIVTDYNRQTSLWWLVILFFTAVIWFSRWRGLRSLIGLALSFSIIIFWIVPEISRGHNPVLATILGSTVILIGGFWLTEGRTRLAVAAMTGTVVTMLLTGFLSLWAVSFAALTGAAGEETLYLQSAVGARIDLRGLLLAGIIIGTLGILDDIAVSQAATVGELWTANPRLSRRQVYQAAMRVGRSHLVAIINTLTLAYAGSALPLLVLFSQSDQPWSVTINNEIVASEIVRSIVGSIGLILALPISTLAAVLLNVRSTHGHQHVHDPQTALVSDEYHQT